MEKSLLKVIIDAVSSTVGDEPLSVQIFSIAVILVIFLVANILMWVGSDFLNGM